MRPNSHPVPTFQVKILKSVKHLCGMKKKIHSVFSGLLLYTRNRKWQFKTLKSSIYFFSDWFKVISEGDSWKVKQTSVKGQRLHNGEQWPCPNKCIERLYRDWGRVGGGGRITFLKPLAHSHWRSRLNINQVLITAWHKAPSSVFPSCNPVHAAFPAYCVPHSAFSPVPATLSPWLLPLALCPLAWKALL